MPFVEQILYGSESGQRAAPRSVLAQSPGLGADAAAEIRRLCDSWGDLPVAGLEAPALLSVPLKATMSSMRGQLWALLRMAAGEAGFVHGLVLNDADYTAFGRNPFALASAVEFLEEWRPGLILDRQTLDEVPDSRLVSPPPGLGDLPLVTESLRHLLTKGKLMLPLEQPGPASDRALALIIAALPAPMRKDLRFASWAGSDGNSWRIAALGKTGCPFSGWQRLLMAEVAAIVPQAVEDYARKVGDRLSAGDLPGLCRVGRDQNTLPGMGPKVPTAPTRTRAPELGTKPLSKRPAAPPRSRPVEPVTGMKAGPAKPSNHPARRRDRVESSRAPQAAPPSHPAPPSGPAPAKPASNYVHPARRGGSPAAASGAPVENWGPPRSAGRARAVARTHLERAGRAVGDAGRRRPKPRRVVPLAVCGALLAALCWWKMPEITSFMSERLGWFGPDEPDTAATEVASLLKAVDVGAVYERSLAAVTRAGAGAAGGRTQDRRRVKLAFQSDAAGPLLQQVDLFATLAADGIQQGSRPDREIERLKALAGQGRILEQEMRRLEVAWYSLDNNLDWRDVGDLDDARIAARRDSLKAAAASGLAAAGREVGTAPAWARLATARLQVGGMVGLLGAFSAERWSEGWEENLHAAAEKVSPSASATTRAYRNTAFALVRLKRAERQPAARDLPFDARFGDGVWPAAEVRDVLADLRKQIQRFDDGAVPEVLPATVALYATLERAGSLARDAAAKEVLADLRGNPAVRFDPAGYGDYLERIRFEAARAALAAAADSTGIPEHLYAGRDSLMAGRFHAALAETTGSTAWRIETLTQEDPFLARWAEHEADRALARELERRGLFAGQWQVCQERQAQVLARAAEGLDWTAQWLDLREQAVGLLDTYVRQSGGDRELASRLTGAADLVRAMDAPRALHLTAVTVRFAPAVFEAATEVLVEFQVVGQGTILRSGPVAVGPAAPQDSGWVGAAAVAWQATLAADDAVFVRVLDAGGRELLRADCPSLLDRVGPGALARPRGNEAGTVAFQLDPGWWSALVLPPLP